MSTASFLTDLAAYCVAHSVGTAVGTDVFIGALPPGTGAMLCLTEYGGGPADRERDTEYPRVQVMVRAESYAAANTLAHAAYALLSEPAAGASQGASTWGYAKALQRPASLGLDEANCWRFVFNLKFWLHRP